MEIPNYESNQTYLIGKSPTYFSVSYFTNPAFQYCPDFDYQILANGGSLNPKLFKLSYSYSKMDFQIYSTNASMAGDYMISISMAYKGITYLAQIFANVVCKIQTIATSQTIQNQVYIVGGVEQKINIQSLTLTPNCNHSAYYTLEAADGTALPSFISFSDKKMLLSFYTADNVFAGDYKVVLKVELVTEDGSSTIFDDISFNLKVVSNKKD